MIEIKRLFTDEVVYRFRRRLAGRGRTPGVNLEVANLAGTDLTGANLEGARLGAADLSGATLIFCNLMGADLTGTNLATANLSLGAPSGSDADFGRPR